MTYEEMEVSPHSGRPVECYAFGIGGADVWFYTSAEEAITLPGWPNPFAPAAIQRERQDHSAEDFAGAVKLTVPRTFAPLTGFISYAPWARVTVVLIQVHRGDEANWITPLRGSVAGVEFEDSLAKVTCVPLTNELDRRVPRLGFHRQCNWALYGIGCAVDRGPYEQPATVAEVDGSRVTAPEFAGCEDGWFTGGWLEWGAMRRFVVNHTGAIVQLMSPFPGLAAGAQLWALPGCDHSEATCAAKFNNLAQHLGFGRVPWRNPHERAV